MRLIFAANLALGTPIALAQSSASIAPEMAAFSLAPLPYAASALEPVIDAETMTLHHHKHHRAYVDGLNKVLASDRKLAGQSLEALLARAGSLPSAIRNHGGGHWNHSFFWSIMAAPETGGAPSPALAKAIDAEFGSLDAMKAAFKTAGTGRFGSGCA